MSTTWLPYTAKTPRWLLHNNEVIDTPALEVTQTGRKVRIKGQQDTAMFSKHLERMMREAAVQYATAHGTKVYGPYVPITLPDGPTEPPFSAAWSADWEIADAEVDGARGRIHVSVRQAYGKEYRTGIEAQILGESGLIGAYGGQDGPIAALNTPYKDKPFRVMAKQILDLAHYLEDQETIPLSPVQNTPAIRQYRVVRTNLNQDVLSQLRDTMIEGNALHDAFVHLKAFRRCMVQAGFALPLDDKSLLAQAEAGKVVEMEFGTSDSAHHVTVDPMTGRVDVKCGRAVNKDDLAGAWETQRLIAELKGEEDAFLGFCRANLFRI